MGFHFETLLIDIFRFGVQPVASRLCMQRLETVVGSLAAAISYIKQDSPLVTRSLEGSERWPGNPGVRPHRIFKQPLILAASPAAYFTLDASLQ